MDVATGYHVWSRTWERSSKDVFAIQDEITTSIIEALRIDLAAVRPEASQHRQTDN